MNLLNLFKNFLDKNGLKNKTILLAFSGGSDSRALFDLLYRVKDEYNINLHLAHVDHSFREKSSLEAEMLQEEMKTKNICFHLKKIKLQGEENIEMRFREERYSFFQLLGDVL